jgi:hypothetical protein
VSVCFALIVAATVLAIMMVSPAIDLFFADTTTLGR